MGNGSRFFHALVAAVRFCHELLLAFDLVHIKQVRHMHAVADLFLVTGRPLALPWIRIGLH